MKEDIFHKGFRSTLAIHEACHLLAYQIMCPDAKFLSIYVDDKDGYLEIDQNTIETRENMLKLMLSGFIGCGIMRLGWKKKIKEADLVDFLSMGAGNGDWMMLRRDYSLNMEEALRISNEISTWFSSRENRKFVRKVAKKLILSQAPLKYEDTNLI